MKWIYIHFFNLYFYVYNTRSFRVYVYRFSVYVWNVRIKSLYSIIQSLRCTYKMWNRPYHFERILLLTHLGITLEFNCYCEWNIYLSTPAPYHINIRICLCTYLLRYVAIIWVRAMIGTHPMIKVIQILLLSRRILNKYDSKNNAFCEFVQHVCQHCLCYWCLKKYAADICLSITRILYTIQI